MTIVKYSSRFEVPPAVLFAFHSDVANLTRISPPIPKFELLSAPVPTKPGDEQVFRLSIGWLKTTWRAEIVRFQPDGLIEDVQKSGPFLRWRHRHSIAAEPGGSRLTDVVAFRMIPGRAGEVLEWFLIRPALVGMLIWRHRKTAAALRRPPAAPRRS